MGLVYDPLGKVALDPDAAVQGALRHLFDCFGRTGSARAVVKEFATQDLSFPQRIRNGPRKDEIVWAALDHYRVLQVLHNPRYAGAFCFGRKQAQYVNGKTSYLRMPRDRWIALIQDTHPGYISFEQWEANQAALLANAQTRGQERRASPPREGPALLQGMVICGRCGARMTLRYHQRRGHMFPDYLCQKESIERAAQSTCQVIPGTAVDHAVASLLLDTLTPVALEVALSVAAELEQRATEADQLRFKHVERARYEAGLARRRYLAVDPDNRLVADALEADWNEKLRQLAEAQDDYDRARENGNARLNEQQRAKVMALAGDFPRLWNDPATPQRERKRMVRLLIEDITLNRDQQITAHVRLKGGQAHTLTLPIPLRCWEARKVHPDTVKLIDRLLEDHTDAETAQRLNQAGRRSGTGQPFSSGIVVHLRREYKLPSHRDRLHARRAAHDQRDRRATRRVHQHNQGLACCRPVDQPHSQRQERAALRTARSRRPTARQTPWSPAQDPRNHLINPTRCSMKPTPLVWGR